MLQGMHVIFVTPSAPCSCLRLTALLRNQIQGATENLPVGKEQAQGAVGGLQKTAGGLASTTGGAVKGVVDMAGNTVSLTQL